MKAVYLYLGEHAPLGVVDEPGLDATTERHRLALTPSPLGREGDVEALLAETPGAGLVIEMYGGWIGRDRLVRARKALALGRRVWLYWPEHHTIECVDVERTASLRRHWLFNMTYRSQSAVSAVAARARMRSARLARAALGVWRSTPKHKLPLWALRRVMSRLSPPPTATNGRTRPSTLGRLDEIDRLIATAAPVPFPDLPQTPDADHRIPGVGIYLRTDFWSRIESGGSYGHTCWVAKELAAVTERFVCFMAYRFRLLDDLGLKQVVLDALSTEAPEDHIVEGTSFYLHALRPALEVLQPAYIYERLVLGNYAGAILSQSMKIPYIVEYNGSEISMRRSFDGGGYLYEEEYLRAEALAFKQATMISVVSDEVRAGLVGRGVSPSKILVNPNGADVSAYAPASAPEKAALRVELQLPAVGPVIGFTGTFGGWHGVDVLAASLPAICERVPEAAFLLIGDGNYKHLIDEAVAKSGLQARVRCTGRVPQTEGARLLKACDIFVSPHSSHMVDSKFFGSPTKIFEYMATAGAIVASDLEQIGQILSPALRPGDLRQPQVTVTDQRAVLCTPGDVAEFTDAVVALAQQPALWKPLGANAQAAIERQYSWKKHVSHLWPFVAAQPRRPVRTADADVAPALATPASARGPVIATGDAYKDEVQRQWDNDPAGSHYVKEAERHTLEWFLEVEAYRYKEYAPWMHETMEFAKHAGERVLEVGGGIGTDLAQFARHGAVVTDLDLSAGHLALARENFERRGLPGTFVLHDAETLPFDDGSFDLVYSNGVIHHTPNTRDVVREIYRVLKPGGRAIIMVYAENSLHYWRNLVLAIGLKEGQFNHQSIGDIMSAAVERSDNASARPLVKVYTKRRLRHLFEQFADIEIVQRQMVPAEAPRLLSRVPVSLLGRMMGWNLVIKARKPRT